MGCASRAKGRKKTMYTEIQGQCEGKMIPSMLPMFSIGFADQDLYTALACHKSPHKPTSFFTTSPFQLRCYTISSKLILFSCLSSTEYDHESHKISKRNLEKEKLIIRHSVEEGEGNNKNKLFFLFLCKYETESKLKRVQNMRQSQKMRHNQKRR